MCGEGRRGGEGGFGVWVRGRERRVGCGREGGRGVGCGEFLVWEVFGVGGFWCGRFLVWGVLGGGGGVWCVGRGGWEGLVWGRGERVVLGVGREGRGVFGVESFFFGERDGGEGVEGRRWWEREVWCGEEREGGVGVCVWEGRGSDVFFCVVFGVGGFLVWEVLVCVGRRRERGGLCVFFGVVFWCVFLEEGFLVRVFCKEEGFWGGGSFGTGVFGEFCFW